MGTKKAKLLQIADRLDKFVLAHDKAREFFTKTLGIAIGALSQADQVKHRAKVTATKPARFCAEFDGASLVFVATVGPERIKISEVLVKNIGDVKKVADLVVKLTKEKLAPN